MKRNPEETMDNFMKKLESGHFDDIFFEVRDEDGNLYSLIPHKDKDFSLKEEIDKLEGRAELMQNLKSNPHNWQLAKEPESSVSLEPADLIDVISNLFTKTFVVRIQENLYDVQFAKGSKGLSFSWSSSPSPHLCSTDFIEKAFREGDWFMVKKKAKKMGDEK